MSQKKRYQREEVSRRLVDFRENVLQLSQAALAATLDMPKRTLQAYEQCSSDLSAEFIVRLNEVTGLDPQWLLLGAGRDPREVRGDAVDLVRAATLGVAEALAARNRTVAPEKLAALVTAVYKRLRQEHGDASRVDILDMVDLAS